MCFESPEFVKLPSFHIHIDRGHIMMFGELKLNYRYHVEFMNIFLDLGS